MLKEFVPICLRCPVLDRTSNVMQDQEGADIRARKVVVLIARNGERHLVGLSQLRNTGVKMRLLASSNHFLRG